MIFMNFPSGYTDRRRRRQQQENAKKEYPKVIDGCDRFERHIEFRRWNRGKQWQIEWKRRWYPRQTETPHYNRQKDHRQRRRRLSKSVSWDLWPSRTFSGRPEIYAEKKTDEFDFISSFLFDCSSSKRRRRKRIKKNSSSSDEDGERGSGKKGRKNIRKVIRSSDLEDETKEAAKREGERKRRIEERQRLVRLFYPNHHQYHCMWISFILFIFEFPVQWNVR